MGTRHNIGFRIVEAFARRHGIALDENRFSGTFGRGELESGPVACLKPETFMNASGQSVAQALEAFPAIDAARDLIVVYDDLDLPVGRLRLRPGGRAGGHRGVGSIVDSLQAPDFPRLRFGVGRPGEGGEAVVDYVLAPFSPSEEALLDVRVAAAVDALDLFFERGIGIAMDQFNSQSGQVLSD